MNIIKFTHKEYLNQCRWQCWITQSNYPLPSCGVVIYIYLLLFQLKFNDKLAVIRLEFSFKPQLCNPILKFGLRCSLFEFELFFKPKEKNTMEYGRPKGINYLLYMKIRCFVNTFSNVFSVRKISPSDFHRFHFPLFDL